MSFKNKMDDVCIHTLGVIYLCIWLGLIISAAAIVITLIQDIHL